TRETHGSLVFLVADVAYKLKKSVKLEFLDYSSPELRRAACEEETRLNARFAPGLYLGVCGVRPAGEGFVLCEAADPRAVDYLVKMRRYAESDTLAGRAQQALLSDDD